MLIEFSVGNYRSFKEPVTFSMVAANLISNNKELDDENTFDIDNDLTLLKTAAIYGANASGKSNLIRALYVMTKFMVNSSKETQVTDKIQIEPFRLNTATEKEPSFFELIFLVEGQKYRYGFEITQDEVVTEWLFYTPKTRETCLFDRENGKIKSSKIYKAKGLAERTRNNALFLSVSAQFNVEIAEKILQFISLKINLASGLLDTPYLHYTVACLVANKNKDEIIQLIKKLDLGISDIHVKQVDSRDDVLSDDMNKLSSKPENGKFVSIGISHQKLDESGDYSPVLEEFDLKYNESEGTNKLFSLAGPLIHTLKEGNTLIIDEFDTKLHPLISLAIIDLFNSQTTNPKNAQLIFTTHDTNLLSSKTFRRDQIWFTEKDRYGATDLYSLTEYKIPNDASFDKDYIKGKYGAIPYLGDLSQLIESHG